MAGVLTTASNVTCGHGGSVATAGAPKLRVADAAVLVGTGVAGRAVSQCSTTPASDGGGPTAIPCISVIAVEAGPAVKLTVGGAAVVLETLTGTTDGMVAKQTPQRLLSGTAEQTKLKAI